MRRIQADSATLLRQASMTADEYLANAIADIDKRLGTGYAKTHPELIAAFMQTAAIDMGSAVIAGAIEDLSETLGSAARALGTGDAASTMGAIEFLAVHLGEKIGEAAAAIADRAQ